MRSKKQRASWVPALIRPPELLASLQEWLDFFFFFFFFFFFCASVILIWDWLDGMKAFKAEADAGIARHRAAARKSG